jgi:Zn-dependent protease
LAVALGFAKFGKWLMLLLKLKWVAGALKSVLSMAAMLGVYSALYGWRFAAGFTVQLLIHELGHVFVARRYGIPVSAPMFVPFVGALILLKERPAKARQEAWMAMGGPMAGGLVAVFLHGAGVWVHAEPVQSVSGGTDGWRAHGAGNHTVALDSGVCGDGLVRV